MWFFNRDQQRGDLLRYSFHLASPDGTTEWGYRWISLGDGTKGQPGGAVLPTWEHLERYRFPCGREEERLANFPDFFAEIERLHGHAHCVVLHGQVTLLALSHVRQRRPLQAQLRGEPDPHLAFARSADLLQTQDEPVLLGEQRPPQRHGHDVLVFDGHERLRPRIQLYRALNLTQSLLHRAKGQIPAWISAEGDTVVVFNPLSWKRSGTVYAFTNHFQGTFEFHRYQVDHLVDAETGEKVAVDNITASEWGGEGRDDDRSPAIAFLVKDVPAFGYRVYNVVIDTTRGTQDEPRALETSGGTIAENEKYRIEVDGATGEILSVFDKQLGKGIAGGKRTDGTAAAFSALESDIPATANRVEVTKTHGETFEKIEIRREGSWFPLTEIRLPFGLEMVEVRNTFDRAVWKVQNPEAKLMEGMLQFPLRLRPEKARVVVASPTGFRRAPQDSLPGSDTTAWPSAGFLSVDDEEACVLLSSPTDYLFMPGKAEGDFFALQTQTVWQMFEVEARTSGRQIYPCTEPREDDLLVHSFALTSRAGSFDAREAYRFGWGYRTELVPQYVALNPDIQRKPEPRRAVQLDTRAQSFMAIEDEDVVAVTLRRSLLPKQDWFVLRLQEIGGAGKREVRIRFAPELRLEWAALADMTERKKGDLPVEDNAVRVPMGPFETLTLALGFAHVDPWQAERKPLSRRIWYGY